MLDMHLQSLFSSSDVVFSASLFCDHQSAVALSGTCSLSCGAFSISFVRYLHVSKWLLKRVRSIVSAYDMACRDISWIDSDDDESDEEMLDVLEMHRAVCGSLYCDYSLAVQKAFTAEPILVSPMLGSLVFALGMVQARPRPSLLRLGIVSGP